MAQETIKFTIRQDGMVSEEVLGVYGDACERLTKRVEDALGHVHFTQETADRYVNNTVPVSYTHLTLPTICSV